MSAKLASNSWEIDALSTRHSFIGLMAIHIYIQLFHLSRQEERKKERKEGRKKERKKEKKKERKKERKKGTNNKRTISAI